jgi:hypothetical protein
MIESIWCSWRINTSCFQSRRFLKCALRRNILIVLLRQTINSSRVEDAWKALASRAAWLRVFQHLSRFELCSLIWWIRHIVLEMMTYLCCRDDCCCTRIQRMRVNLLRRLVDSWRSCEDTVRSLTVELSFEQKFKLDPRIDVRSNWTDQSSQFDLRIDVRRVLSSLFETSYIWKGEKKFFVSSI